MRKLLAPLAITGLLLTGCGSTSQGTEPAAKQEGKPAAKCVEVGDKMLNAIAEGASGVEIKPVEGAAVKSEDFDKVYMIAMEFSAPGGGNETGVWASDSLKPSQGLIVSVDGFAKNFTTWPDAAEAFDISQADHGVSEAKNCLGD